METRNLTPLFLGMSVIGLLFGGFFAVEEWFIGASFATNDSLIWTLPLVAYMFLALTSTGVSIILTAGELLGNQVIKAHKSILLMTALSLLIGAFASLATELGSFLNVFWLLLTPNLKSPIWWMGTLYSIELLLLGIKFYALLTHRQFSIERWLTIGTLCVAVSASLVLGSVFGTSIARFGYYGMDASILTFILALASGFSIAPLLIRSGKRDALVLTARITLIILALFLVVKSVYLTRSSILAEGSWVSFWMPILLMLALAIYKVKPVISTVIALVTLLLIEFAFVIQGQEQVLGPKQTWFGAIQHYQGNFAEVGILVFGCSVAYLSFFVCNILKEKVAIVK